MDKEKKYNKKSKNNKLILLKSIIEENNKKLELTEQETKLKKRLIEIESKLESIEKVINSVSNESSNTIFNSDAFHMLVESIAVTAAVSAVAEYLEISVDDIEDIIK